MKNVEFNVFGKSQTQMINPIEGDSEGFSAENVLYERVKQGEDIIYCGKSI